MAVITGCGILVSAISTAASVDNYPFSIEIQKESDGHRIVAHNEGPAPISVKVSISEAQGIATDRPFPAFAVVPPGGGTLYLGRIRAAVQGQGYSFRTQNSWVMGDYNAEQSRNAQYSLPYQDGQAFYIGQAPGGPITTHLTPDSQYAVDIGMPQGTPILAARDGVVIYTEADQYYGAQNPDMMGKANVVEILHQDGTIAMYAHMEHGGVYVYPGQRVAAGTPIGLAGSTGYSSGPHLHFAIQKVIRSGDALLQTVSVPFHFFTGNPPVVFAPLYGMLAKAGTGPVTPVAQMLPDPGTDRERLERGAMPRPPGIWPEPPVSQAGPGAESDGGRGWRNISVWQWAAVLVALYLFLLLMDNVRTRRRQERLMRRMEPGARSKPVEDQTVVHRLSAEERLLVACGGDRERTQRLMAFEYQKAPAISNEEAAWRAIERLQRDRR